MVDTRSPAESLTVLLPIDLITELQALAKEKQRSVDEIVLEACLDYTEPYIWERCYKEHLRKHPGQPKPEFGIEGDDLTLPENPA
jgi:hypothetical protein